MFDVLLLMFGSFFVAWCLIFWGPYKEIHFRCDLVFLVGLWKTQWDFLFAMDLKKHCWKTDLTGFNVGPKNSCKYGPITPLIGVQEKQRNPICFEAIYKGSPHLRFFVGGIGSGVGHLGDFHILGTEEILERLKPVETWAVTSLGLVVMNATNMYTVYLYIYIWDEILLPSYIGIMSSAMKPGFQGMSSMAKKKWKNTPALVILPGVWIMGWS